MLQSIRMVMRILGFLVLAMISVFIFPSDSLEIPFAFSRDNVSLDNLTQDEIVNIYKKDSNLLRMPPLATKVVNISEYGELKAIFNSRISTTDYTVDRIKKYIVGGRLGTVTIYQVMAIYDYLKYGKNEIGGWNYVRDPSIVPNESKSKTYSFANDTLNLGESMGISGSGDCEDFAIVMASLIGAIDGSFRIVAVPDDYGNPIHAYCEVYLGNLNERDNKVYYLSKFLMCKYGVDEIYTHIDPSNKDVWLNLDAPLTLGNRAYPGYPFSPGSVQHYVVLEPSLGPKNEIEVPEYRDLIKILNYSMYSQEGNAERIKIDQMVDLLNALSSRNGLNENATYSTEEFMGYEIDLLASFGIFNVDMLELTCNSTYREFVLGKILNGANRMNESNTVTNPNFALNPTDLQKILKSGWNGDEMPMNSMMISNNTVLEAFEKDFVNILNFSI